MANESRALPRANSDELSLDERIEAALAAYHVADPRRVEEVELMRTDLRAMIERGDDEEAARLTDLCVDYIRQGSAAKE